MSLDSLGAPHCCMVFLPGDALPFDILGTPRCCWSSWAGMASTTSRAASPPCLASKGRQHCVDSCPAVLPSVVCWAAALCVCSCHHVHTANGDCPKHHSTGATGRAQSSMVITRVPQPVPVLTCVECAHEQVPAALAGRPAGAQHGDGAPHRARRRARPLLPALPQARAPLGFTRL